MNLLDRIKNVFSPVETHIQLSDLQLEKLEESIVEKNRGRITMQEFQEKLQDIRHDSSMKNYHVNLAYTSIYTRISQHRHQMFKEIERIRGNWLVETIIDQITEDALSPDVATGNILDVTSKKPKIKKAIKDLDEKYGFDTIVKTNTPDMLLYGDYLLSTEINKSPDAKEENNLSEAEDKKPKEFGLIELNDNVIQHMVIALTKFSEVEEYLCMDIKGNVVKKEESEFVRFSMDARKIRIDLHEELYQGCMVGYNQQTERVKAVLKTRSSKTGRADVKQKDWS